MTMKFEIIKCTSGRTNDKQGSINDASRENSPTPISLSRSRLKGKICLQYMELRHVTPGCGNNRLSFNCNQDTVQHG